MRELSSINDFVIRFANVNGTGSASANSMFAKAIFRMGIPVSPKNIFPSNIQGLPTWYEVRVSEKGYLGRRDGVDIMVSINPQSFHQDMETVKKGGYFIYDSTKFLPKDQQREDIHILGVPMMEMSMQNFLDPRRRQLFKNMIYVGVLASLLNIKLSVFEKILNEQFSRKPQLVPPNIKALKLGMDYAHEHFQCPLPVRLEERNLIKDEIIIDGNSACALGALYGGATVVAWYPITPSTSVAQSFEKFSNDLRIDPESGLNNFAIVQAEDELAAMGVVIGAAWNGARAFTTTSGPGVSLMSEFIGLAYFAEIPAVLINVQRGGPSTGMPTRTQQSDILAAAYCSHGDTKHVLLFPSTPKECFDMTAQALDLADRFQTPIFVMSDLDLGMNEHMSPPFKWDDNRKYDRGKVLSAKELEKTDVFGRYLDVDGDGIPYRTIPGSHPSKGSYFTRGTSKDEYAKYTENGEVYVRNVDRLLKKFDTVKEHVPGPILYQQDNTASIGMVFFGTTNYAATEVMDLLRNDGIGIDALRIKAFPFTSEIANFIDDHNEVFVVEQNRDAQMRTLIINELDVNPKKLIPILNYNGNPISADIIYKQIKERTAIPSMTKNEQP